MNNRETLYAGIGGGLLFGITQSLSAGFVQGITTGIFFGVAFGLMIRWFANSQTVQKQTQFPESLLLPGERVLHSKLANLVIRPADFGLDDFAFGGLLWVVGMKKKESLGGALHITNYRIVFRSHRYNRLRGMTSIFLPTIEKLDNQTILIFRKLAVSTAGTKVEFVIGDVDQVISHILSACEQLDGTSLAELKHHVRQFPNRCSDELQPWRAFNKFNILFNFGNKATNVTRAITNPLATLSSICINELLDKTICNSWQKVFLPTTDLKAVRPIPQSETPDSKAA